MDFTHLVFIVSLPIFFVLYWSVNGKTAQNILLLIASYIFYGWIHPWFCLLIASSTIVDFWMGLLLVKQKRKEYLIISLFVNLGLLAAFKYFNFFSTNIANCLSFIGLSTQPYILEIILPVGISFYTFQTLSYTIDIYKGDCKATTNFLDFAVFVAFFPQLVAGPIERAKNLLPQIQSYRVRDSDNLIKAVTLVARGYFKKIVVADSLASYVERIFALDEVSLGLLSIGVFLFSIQIFCDFSGYSDIARGLARSFGLRIMVNFNSPFLALNPTEFWRRWHISLSTWFRDYVFKPLGGSRKGNVRLIIAIMTTFLLSGLWHGAAWNYVLWGFYHSIILILFRFSGLNLLAQKGVLSRFFSWGMTFILIQASWFLFRSTDIISHLFERISFNLYISYSDVTTSLFLVFLAAVLSAPLLIESVFKEQIQKIPIAAGACSSFFLVSAFVFYNVVRPSFIYFQF